jgi:hypothetical protein
MRQREAASWQNVRFRFRMAEPIKPISTERSLSQTSRLHCQRGPGAFYTMRSMRSMRGGFIFHNRGPSLKVHHCQHLASVTKHDTGGYVRSVGFDTITVTDLISAVGGPR